MLLQQSPADQKQIHIWRDGLPRLPVKIFPPTHQDPFVELPVSSGRILMGLCENRAPRYPENPMDFHHVPACKQQF